jgi:hypothetical protein
VLSFIVILSWVERKNETKDVRVNIVQTQNLALGDIHLKRTKILFYYACKKMMTNLNIESCKQKPSTSKQGVCHTVALPFTLKSILRQKKNYGNSNISP